MTVRIRRCIGVFLLMLPLVLMGMVPTPVAAADLEIRGSDIGLEVLPSGTNFFDLIGMDPGDSSSGTLTIRNSYAGAFALYMRAEKNGAMETPDLFNILKLKVVFRGAIVFDGNMKDFAAVNTALGSFQPGEVQTLSATVSLPGPETGNEYQGKTTRVKWIFTAQSSYTPPGPNPDPDPSPDPGSDRDRADPPVIENEPVPLGLPVTPPVVIPEETIPLGPIIIPKTGEHSPELFYALGLLSILCGSVLLYSTRHAD